MIQIGHTALRNRFIPAQPETISGITSGFKTVTHYSMWESGKLIDLELHHILPVVEKIIRTMEQKVLRHRSSTGNMNCIRQAIFMQSGLFFYFILRSIPTKAARHSGISHKSHKKKSKQALQKRRGIHNRHWPCVKAEGESERASLKKHICCGGRIRSRNHPYSHCTDFIF